MYAERDGRERQRKTEFGNKIEKIVERKYNKYKYEEREKEKE